VLNGIGGNTIAQAKENMSHKEALRWAVFIRERGSLNMGLRIEKQVERSIALLCAVVNNSAGGKAKMSDFLPGVKKEEVVTDISQVAGMLKSIAKPKKRGVQKMKYSRAKKTAPKN